MSLTTTLSEAVDLIRRNVYALLVIGAAVYVPLDLAAAAIDDTRGWGDVSVARLGVFALVLAVGATLAYGAAIAAIAVEPEGAEERPRTPLLALRDAAARWPTLILITIVACLGVLAGAALLIVPGIVLFTWWFLAFQPAIVESTGWRASLGRSRELVRGSFWPVLALALIVAVGATLLDYAIYRVAEAALPQFVAAWSAGVVGDTIATVVTAAATTAAYWQLTDHHPRIPRVS